MLVCDVKGVYMRYLCEECGRLINEDEVIAKGIFEGWAAGTVVFFHEQCAKSRYKF